MSSYCPECGSPIPEGAKFCDNCGTGVTAQAAPAQPQQQAAPAGGGFYQQFDTQQFNSFSSAAQAMPEPIVGWSTRANDPEILAAMKKNKNATRIFALIFIPLPLIGFTIYSLVSDKMEPQQGVLYGAIVSLIFLICALVSATKRKVTKPYEAVVTGKKTRERLDHNQDNAHYYTEYITYAQTTDGKKRKIVERDGSLVTAYHYLQVGDRFKYHPQFNFPYELYDKAKAPYIACVSCGTKNSVTADRCSKCNIPLLK